MAMTTVPIIETIAQIIHEYRHRMGSGSTCDECREKATEIYALIKSE